MVSSISLINAGAAGGAGAPRAGSPELPNIVDAIVQARKNDPEVAVLPFSTLPTLKHMLETEFPALARSGFFDTTPILLEDFTHDDSNAMILCDLRNGCSEYMRSHFQFNQEIEAAVTNHTFRLKPKPDKFLAIKLDATNAPRLVTWLAATFPCLTAVGYFAETLCVAPGTEEFTVDDPELLALGGDFMTRHNDATIQQHFQDHLGELETVVKARYEAEGKFIPIEALIESIAS